MEYYSTIKRVKYWSLVVKNPPANVGDVRVVGSIPGSGRSPGGGHGNPLQYFCLKNPMDRGNWRATIHGITKSWTRLSLHTHTHTHTTQAVITEIAGICQASHSRGFLAPNILSSVLGINLLLLQQQSLDISLLLLANIAYVFNFLTTLFSFSCRLHQRVICSI